MDTIKLTLPVEVFDCSPTLFACGDWGQACVMAFTCRDPRTGELMTVEQAVRVTGPSEWRERMGDPMTVRRRPQATVADFGRLGQIVALYSRMLEARIAVLEQLAASNPPSARRPG